MKKICWATDIHIDHLKNQKLFDEFLKSFLPYDQIIITGDIASSEKSFESFTTETTLFYMAKKTKKEIYFVLGNHDCWGGWIADIREKISRIDGVTYLHNHAPIMLTENCSLIGVDGWYDAFYGYGLNSRIQLNDWDYILDFKFSGMGVGNLCIKLAQENAKMLETQLKDVTSDVILVATHIPPWPQNSKHNGTSSNDHYLPWYTSKSTGDVIEQYAKENLDKKIVVLCGHSHDWADNNITDNIRCITGRSVYGFPSIQHIDINKLIE